jgi:hypothetical protein
MTTCFFPCSLQNETYCSSSASEGHLRYPELNTIFQYDRRVSDPYLFFAHLQIATSNEHHGQLAINTVSYTSGFPFRSSCGFRLLSLKVSQFLQFAHENAG